ncbi:2,7-anhydro-N-acetylneuraminate hydratase-like [Macrobrachium rosenbergii]|uniref:2,7-anhydro-N-acetylneuraminate hydratase-like n=1 Tax=Macrobrachium rosenbergii TaxID=79674 RepID=UPI0034D7B132
MNCIESTSTKTSHRKVTAVVVGAGNRGKNYANYAIQFPELFDVVAVAEPRRHAREYFQHNHSIETEKCFDGWETLVLQPRLADCAIVATQDQDHVKPTVKLAKIGYHILLEKPMAVTEEDCRTIYEACQEAGVMLAVCHVLRYHPPARKLKELIDSGLIGEVVNINHTEPVEDSTTLLIPLLECLVTGGSGHQRNGAEALRSIELAQHSTLHETQRSAHEAGSRN